MISRFAITALAMGALTGAIAAAAGCSADECTKASEHFSQCLGTNLEAIELASVAPRCECEYLCSSNCVNTSDCETIQEVFNGDAGKSDAAKGFIECRSKCLALDCTQ